MRKLVNFRNVPFSILLVLIFGYVKAENRQLKENNDEHKIENLPGLTFVPKFKQYSGYLNGVSGNYLHYWLVESQSKPNSDPLILWLNGGPGCSSLGGFFTELGPFFPNQDGRTLFENVYSWNKEANVLFIEAPRDVGFSYQNASVNSDTDYNDNKTAFDNFLAVKQFMALYPQYKTRPFYITGESYGGIYIPTLASELIRQIQTKNLTANFKGMAIGNGELSEILQINSAVDFMYFHGIYGKDEWDALKACCPTTEPLAYCNFSRYINVDEHGTVSPVDASPCAQRVTQLGFDRVWLSGNDVYNLYQDCYQLRRVQTSSQIFRHIFEPIKTDSLHNFTYLDQGSLINWKSTDNLGSFPCYSSSALETYLNRVEVRDAIRVPKFLQKWVDCNPKVTENYRQQYSRDMTPIFDDIINSGYKLKILVYNGDADTVCNFLGDEWFVERLRHKYNMNVTQTRQRWTFAQAAEYKPQIAGYHKAFAYDSSRIEIDLVTVKGAGHFVPMDRSGPALQMITNFIKDVANYSTPTGYGTERQPLIPVPYHDKNETSAAASQIFSTNSKTIMAVFSVTFCALHSLFLVHES